ncbi:hypothetical protein VTG60DRAFT_3259 [Thermothelomyces hinnuleus]
MGHEANIADNAYSLSGRVLVTSAVAPSIAILFVALRLYTARRILGTVRLDDWLILVALTFSVGYTISIGFLTNHGLGHHRKYLDAQNHGPFNLAPLFKINILPTTMTGNQAALFTKASILRFYLRFSMSRRFTIAIHALTVIPGSCIRLDQWYGSLAAFNFVTDAILLVMPVWILGPLRVSLAQKAALAAILGAGSFVLAVSIFRFAIVARGIGNDDFTYRFARNFIWSIFEINVGIACACAPCLRALVGRYFPSLLQLGRRDDPDLYTIPLSELGQRLPGTPDRRLQDATCRAASGGAVAANWRSKLFGSASSGSEQGFMTRHPAGLRHLSHPGSGEASEDG